MVLSFISFSQQSEWEFYKDIDGVKFEIRTIECLVMNYLHSEFQTRDYSVYVLWKEEVWIDGICKQNGDSSEDERKLKSSSLEKLKDLLVTLKSFYIGSKVKRVLEYDSNLL